MDTFGCFWFVKVQGLAVWKAAAVRHYQCCKNTPIFFEMREKNRTSHWFSSIKTWPYDSESKSLTTRGNPLRPARLNPYSLNQNAVRTNVCGLKWLGCCLVTVSWLRKHQNLGIPEECNSILPHKFHDEQPLHSSESLCWSLTATWQYQTTVLKEEVLQTLANAVKVHVCFCRMFPTIAGVSKSLNEHLQCKWNMYHSTHPNPTPHDVELPPTGR